jgi:alkanesulfonate monooxygenase SsuD/methylene tetrahydromethanopterin reductase-like flavin-dependent oxidoreductase (luciferase family)
VRCWRHFTIPSDWRKTWLILDILSRGRSIATVGLGYRPEEYLALGKSWQQRGQLLDDSISTLLKAWSGEPFTHNGATVQVLPRPYSRPHPILCVGGNSKAAARRAARFGLPFSPAIDDEELAKVYYEESVARGFTTPYVIMPQHPATTFIAEDPQRAWTQLGEFMLYDALAYGRWHHPTRRAYAESSATSIGQLRAEGKYRVLQPQQALELLRAGESLHLAPLVGGAAPELGWRSLRLFTEQVAPQLG